MIDPQLLKTDLETIQTNLKKRDLNIDLQNLKIRTNDISWIQEKKTGCLLKCCVIFGFLIGKGYVS